MFETLVLYTLHMEQYITVTAEQTGKNVSVYYPW